MASYARNIRDKSALRQLTWGVPPKFRTGNLVSTALAPIDADHARLPAFYEQAKESIAVLDRIDECKEWADKAAALASYARQSQDQELSHCALRIRARAVRRMGELLADYQNKEAGLLRGGDVPTTGTSQRSIAAASGISKDQEVSARRLASIPNDDFERIMESASPPSITALAQADRSGRVEPKHFVKTTSISGVLTAFLSQITSNTPEQYCFSKDDSFQRLGQG